MEKYCLICGKEFETDGHKKTCGPECAKKQAEKSRLRHKKEHPVIKPPKTKYQGTCPICGSKFVTTNINMIYCDDVCRVKARDQRYHGKSVPDPQPKEVFRETKKKTKSLDAVVRACCRKGITYSEWQRKQTTAMYARVEV